MRLATRTKDRSNRRRLDHDVSAIIETMERRQLLTTIFHESFESGLSDAWTVQSVDPEARVQIRDLVSEGIITNAVSQQFAADGNSNSLVFDSTNASGDLVNDLGIAVVTVDLSGNSRAVLTFKQYESDDENQSLPDQHQLATPGDGLAVSMDGVTWYRLLNQEGDDINRSGDGRWLHHEYDLDAEFARINAELGAGLSFSSNVQFKFSQYDNVAMPDDGWAIDDLLIFDQSAEFDASRERGVFHRFNLAGEDDADFYYRAAVFGDADENTPIVVSVHGSNGDPNFGVTWLWQRFVADPTNGVDSLIVVTPAFVESVGPGRFGAPGRYNFLAWNTTNDSQAGKALLDTVDAIAAAGVGDNSAIHLWGFSAGGQFVGRFAAAYPDRVASAVVGGPATQILPTERVSYPFGTGRSRDYPRPADVNLDIPDFLRSRIMYWVGQNDSDPNHSQLTRGPVVDGTQGLTRRERSMRQFEMMHSAAIEAGLGENDFEYELFIAEGYGHGWNQAAIPGIYEFMMRNRVSQDPIRIHPRIVRTASADDQLNVLPQSLEHLKPSETFFLELWVDAPPGVNVQSGTVDLFFDTDLTNVINVDHGAFSTGGAATVDEAAGRIRGLTGAASEAANSEYQLFSRIQMQTTGNSLSTADWLEIAIQRNDGSHFQTSGGGSHRTDFMPLPFPLVGDTSQGITRGGLRGQVFGDANSDGRIQSDETAHANYTVDLIDPVTQEPMTNTFAVEPDDYTGHGAYLSEVSPWVTLTPVGSEPIAPGIRAFNKGTDESSTGVMVFSFNRDDGTNTQWVENLRSLRMDFTAPTKSVSIDIIAKLNDANDVGRLEVYDSSGTLLEVRQSSQLMDAEFETVTITRPTADIAYALATGVGSNRVRLDNLQFESLLTTTTGAQGEFSFPEISSGNYRIRVTPEGGTYTEAQVRDETVAAGVTTSRADIGFPVPPPPLPDLVTAGFDALTDHVIDARTNVRLTVRNSGDAPSGNFQTQIILSANDVLGDTDDVPVSNLINWSSINRGFSLSRVVTVQLDRSTLYDHALAANPAWGNRESSESMRLFHVVDPTNATEEISEVNNAGRGHQIDSDDITYFPWSGHREVVTPSRVLQIISAIGTSAPAFDFRGLGIVTPLLALETLQRIGFIRNDDVVENSATLSLTNGTTVVDAGAGFAMADERKNLFATTEWNAPERRVVTVESEETSLDAAWSETASWLDVLS